MQLLAATLGGHLARVSSVMPLQGVHGPFTWAPGDGDWCSVVRMDQVLYIQT